MSAKSSSDTKIISKLFFRLLPVQILLVAISGINSIIDGAIAGKYIGVIAMTVIGLYYPILKIIDSVNAVLTSGSQILCGQFLGKNEIEKTRMVFSLDIAITFFFSIFLGSIMLFISKGLASVMGANIDSINELSDYMRGLSIGIFAQLLSAQFSVFLQLEQQEKRTYIGIGVMMVSNLTLNLVFINVLNMGPFGLGLSTSISNWLFCIIQMSYYFTKKAIIRFNFKSVSLHYLKDILRIGIPGALGQFFQTVRGLFINYILLKYIGNDGLAAYSAVGTFGCAYFAVTAGVASATRLLVSVYIGEEDREGLYRIMRTALIKGMALVTATSIMFMFFAVPFTRLFYTDTTSNVYTLAKQFFFIFPISMIFSCFTCVFTNYYQCFERMKIVNILSFIDGTAGMVICSFILTPFMGAMGVWISQVLNGVITSISIIIYTVLSAKKFPTGLSDFLLLPDTFGVPEENRLNISISSVDGVLNTSQKVIDFCRTHNIDRKHTFYSGLCIEEMAGNIVQHGFKNVNGRTKNSVDICVVYKEGGILIRFKDNCKPFNPRERESIFNPEDVTANIGIRMVARLSNRMEYHFVLGLNVLSVWV